MIKIDFYDVIFAICVVLAVISETARAEAPGAGAAISAA